MRSNMMSIIFVVLFLIFIFGCNENKVKWRVESNVSSKPVMEGDYICFTVIDRYLHCINKNTGKLEWRITKFNSSIFGFDNVAGRSPLIKDGIVYFTYGKKIEAVNLSDGKELWVIKIDSSIISRPAIFGNRLFVGSESGDLISINIDEVRIEWRKKFNGSIFSPIKVNNTGIYFTLTDLDGKLNLLKVNKETKSLIWKYSNVATIFEAPVLHDKDVYIFLRDNILCCLEAETGNLKWEFLYKEKIPSLKKEALKSDKLVFSQNFVYVSPGDGNLYCLDKESGKTNWQYFHGEDDPGMIMVENNLILSAKEYLYFFKKKNGEVVKKCDIDYDKLIEIDKDTVFYFETNNGIMAKIVNIPL